MPVNLSVFLLKSFKSPNKIYLYFLDFTCKNEWPFWEQGNSFLKFFNADLSLTKKQKVKEINLNFALADKGAFNEELASLVESPLTFNWAFQNTTQVLEQTNGLLRR